jgi:NAD(P)-dependent dehydrogenase (short-subunit alcohol dehydrogenase family)
MTDRRARRAVLITGSNTGLGKDLARKLVAGGDADKVYLACRNEAKGLAAKRDLEEVTGRSVFDVVVMDVSKPASVRAAIAAIDRPLDAVVMNAGGTGGATPFALTEDGVTEVFASNVLGHVVLLEQLIADGALTEVAVLTGSEAARGVPKLRIPRPTFETHSVEEFTSVIDGSFFNGRKANASLAYGQVKYLAALWMSALAREHPGLRFTTMSPGNTSGTDVMRELPGPLRFLVQRVVLPHVAPLFGIAHPLESGTARLADAVTDAGLRSGTFYASAADTITGPVIDQADVVSDFRDSAIQDNAARAVRRFVPARRAASS